MTPSKGPVRTQCRKPARSKKASTLALAATILSLSWGTAAQAQTADEPWQVDLTIYGYLPTVRGTTLFPNGHSGPNINLNNKEVLSHLRFASMGQIRIQKGRWGAHIDVFYASLSDKVHGSHQFNVPNIPLPVDIRGNFKLHSKTLLLTMTGTYQLTNNSSFRINALVGARLNQISQSLDWSLSSPEDPDLKLSG